MLDFRGLRLTALRKKLADVEGRLGRLHDLDIALNAATDVVEIRSARRDPLKIDPLPARDAQASTTMT
jgi:hypothetical protein